jgi:hypothetical protein
VENETPATNGNAEAAGSAGTGALAQDTASPGSAAQGGEVVRLQMPQPPPEQDPTGQAATDGASATGAGARGAKAASDGGNDRHVRALTRSWLGVVTRNRWWRRNLGDNFSLEHELDAKIDRLRVTVSTMPDNVMPAMDAKLREQLLQQLQRAAELLDDCEPFERVMQRISFVETEIMMRLADDHLDLAIEALRAEASISLPVDASKQMLDEIDKLAGSTEEPPKRKVRIVGLKARLTASVIELFRGSERARDAIQILGVALIALTFALGGLFYGDLKLRDSLFTHYGDAVALQTQPAFGQPAATARPDGGTDEPAVPGAATPSAPQATIIDQSGRPGALQLVHLPDGPSRLIGFGFPVLVMASFFGGIGACLSGLFSFTLQGRVPNEYEGWFRTLIRPVIGIASGFLAVVILRSGLLTFGDDLAWVAITALAFGFSERLFMGTMERLEGLPK